MIGPFAGNIATFLLAYRSFGFLQQVPLSQLATVGWISILSATVYMSWMAIYYANIMSMRSDLERGGGAPPPSACARPRSSLTVAAEIGYFFTPNFAIGLAGGYPPLVKVEAKGSITGLGTLGEVDGGPTALTAQYHLTGLGRFRPHIGTGPSLMIVFKDHGGVVADVKTDRALGFTGQVSLNYMLDNNWGVFVDLKEAYLRAKTSGSLGGAPIRATVTLDPLVLHAGLTYKFRALAAGAEPSRLGATLPRLYLPPVIPKK